MHMVAGKHILIVTLVSLLTGCSTLSEKECKTADWESIGYQDGSRGYNAARISEHIDACSEYGIKPDREEYDLGRGRGLQLYCAAESGYRLGRQGGSYSGVCPIELETDFLDAYHTGQRLYDYEQDMQKVRAEMDSIDVQLHRDNPPLKDSERDSLIYRLRELERQYGRMQSDRRRLEQQTGRY
jgi:hypothetical protein